MNKKASNSVELLFLGLLIAVMGETFGSATVAEILPWNPLGCLGIIMENTSTSGLGFSTFSFF